MDAAWEREGLRCVVVDGGVCDRVRSAPASAADRQTEDRHHRVDKEKRSMGTEMVSGPKYELA